MFLVQSWKLGLLSFLFWFLFTSTANYCSCIADASNNKSSEVNLDQEGLPTIMDTNLKLELVTKGLHSPTSMAFLGPDDLLVLEKDNGTVRRIVNGTLLGDPLLDVEVATRIERGMLGIAVAREETSPEHVFLFVYYTESKNTDGEDLNGEEPLGNRLYRYELIGNKLVNPKLLLDLPATPGPMHNGGVTLIGPDNNVYLVIGDVKGPDPQEKGKTLDSRSSIITINQDGETANQDGILGDEDPVNEYYAYGIRNSFGMDFDPVTGNLWDTENGPGFGDEINLVEPGFNSGWKKVQGVWKPEDYSDGRVIRGQPDNLEDFDGKAKYSKPEFTWERPVGVTAIKFLGSEKLGKEYENDMFIGDINNGNLYRFDLTKDRREVTVDNQLEDKIAHVGDNIDNITFGKGFDGTGRSFAGISDIEVGPDGYLYVLSYGQGAIYRIIPK
ncbi:MAG TPA: PQQ-dependent sugar dehydrogenase [Nitrososphaeraceae archaeon]|nr:PQQ-dependent sugar dehydrogenase [Nitrososphaeraceae archaeon]